ncbi:hypothetical protein V8F33_013142 [Rhypophila sp. PSN 637]
MTHANACKSYDALTPMPPAQQLTEFHLFPYLPVELQMMVWEMAPVTRRSIRITMIGLDIVTPADDKNKKSHPLLYVCHLSRQIALKQVVRTMRLVRQGEFAGVYQDYLKPHYVNPSNDLFELWGFGPQTRDLLMPATPDDAEDMAVQLPRDLRFANIDTTVMKTLLIHMDIVWVQFQKNWSTSWPKNIRKVFPNVERIIFLSSSDSRWAGAAKMPIAEKISQEMFAMDDKMNDIDRNPSKLKVFDSVLVKDPRSMLRLHKIGEGAYFAESDNYHYSRKMEL